MELSFLVYNTLTETKVLFSSQCVKRGIYKTFTGQIINADTNGTMNNIGVGLRLNHSIITS
jgi:N6-adenosine-specific RNA methylase IME4